MPLKNRIRFNFALAAVLPGLLFAAVAAADLQDDLNARWRGAWIIVKGDIYSNCNGLTTDNRISGDLLRGNGRFAFAPGELARITKVDSKRRRVDVKLELRENLLVEYRDGPFTLYREAACEVELVIDFNNQRTKDLGVAGIEAQFSDWFERHARLDDAMDSPGWNGRLREPYPDDYDATLFAHEVWRVEQHNELIAVRIEESQQKIGYVLASVSTDREFGAGLGLGMAAMRDSIDDSCNRLVSSSLRTFASKHEATSSEEANGFETGQELAYHIELSRRLAGCYLEPPIETDAFPD